MKIEKKVSRRDAETQRETTTEVVVAKPVEPEVMPSLGEIEKPDYTKPAECINFHLGMAQHHGRVAIAHLIVAGQELAKQKQVLGYGGWNEFCAKELSVDRTTADRYVKFFYKVIVERRTAGVPFDKRVTNKELAEATVGMEGKSATRAMVDLGIIKRPNGWGGAARGQGRKPKGDAEVAAELKAIAENESVLWAAAKGAIDNLVQLDSGRDVFHRLSDEHLATASGLLADLAGAAAKALEKRLGAAGDGTPALPTNR